MKNKLIIAIAFLKYLTLVKIWNLLLLSVSFQLSRILKRPIIWGRPATLSIEPTTSCNLRCPECPSGLRSFTRATGMLEPKLFKRIIDDAKDHLSWLHIYFQGEPFLNPRFFEMVHYADSNNIFTSTSTNAHYLGEKQVKQVLESGLKQLIISVDGITQEVYQLYRIGGNLKTVQQGIELLLRTRNESNARFPRIILQMLVTGQNEHEIPAMKKWAIAHQIDEIQLKTTQIYNFGDGSQLIPSDLGYSRYVPTPEGKWKLKNTLENKCWRMWQGSVITWDGKLVPCCFDKDAKHVLGDLQSQSISSIWTSQSYQNFRSQLLKDRTSIEICRNCTE